MKAQEIDYTAVRYMCFIWKRCKICEIPSLLTELEEEKASKKYKERVTSKNIYLLSFVCYVVIAFLCSLLFLPDNRTVSMNSLHYIHNMEQHGISERMRDSCLQGAVHMLMVGEIDHVLDPSV